MSKLPQKPMPQKVEGGSHSSAYMLGLYNNAINVRDFYANRYDHLTAAATACGIIINLLSEINENLGYCLTQLDNVLTTLQPIEDSQFQGIKDAVNERITENQSFSDDSGDLKTTFEDYLDILNEEAAEALEKHNTADDVATYLYIEYVNQKSMGL